VIQIFKDQLVQQDLLRLGFRVLLDQASEIQDQLVQPVHRARVLAILVQLDLKGFKVQQAQLVPRVFKVFKAPQAQLVQQVL
jgi:hypothetical protein